MPQISLRSPCYILFAFLLGARERHNKQELMNKRIQSFGSSMKSMSLRGGLMSGRRWDKNKKSTTFMNYFDCICFIVNYAPNGSVHSNVLFFVWRWRECISTIKKWLVFPVFLTRLCIQIGRFVKRSSLNLFELTVAHRTFFEWIYSHWQLIDEQFTHETLKNCYFHFFNSDPSISCDCHSFNFHPVLDLEMNPNRFSVLFFLHIHSLTSTYIVSGKLWILWR